MHQEYPFLKITKPDGTQYQIGFEDLVELQEGIAIGIGRLSDNHIVLPDPHKTISKHHCSLRYQKNRWWIVDENSSNGTFLQRQDNSAEIDVRSQDRVVLKSGDRILILGELNTSEQPIFWQLEFVDPSETLQVSGLQAIYGIEYNLSSEILYRNVAHHREAISLSQHERSLIDYMCRKNHKNNNQTTLCEYDELIRGVWQDDFNRERGDINHLAWRIRKKIEIDSGEPQFLKTISNRGYSLEIRIIE